MVSKKNLSNRLEDIKVPFELRFYAIRLYENVISKFNNIEGWSKEINCSIGVKQGCPLSPTIFGIYIDKLEDCLEEAGCVNPTLTGIVINILLYPDDIVLMVRSPHDLENQLRILKDFFSNMGMTVNTDNTKVMIIKSNKITYDTSIYANNNLEEVTSYKYFRINIHHKLNWNYSIRKRIIG
jgi:acetyltransferase-like isoleucine patch superfamily enzyme